MSRVSPSSLPSGRSGLRTLSLLALLSAPAPFLGACTGTPQGTPNDLACGAGLTSCSDGCRDLTKDPANCGKCGTACGPDDACEMGACVLHCSTGLTRCGQSCVNLQSDNQSCGACGTACAAGQVCSAGKCAVSCQAGLTVCNGTCTNLMTDVANCGACGTGCAAGQVCSSGTCAVSCQTGLTKCNETCVNVASDNQNCGACGKACGAGQVCSSGTCALSCQTSLTNCNGVCANLQSDNQNCGACGTACPAGQVCTSGTCTLTCQSGLTNCNGTCTNVKLDPSNCGACGKVCGTGQLCSSGTCASTCASPLLLCASSCVDPRFDPANCGGCGMACPTAANSTPLCSSGACVVVCATGFLDCDAKTSTGCEVDGRTSVANCGACGRVCPAITNGSAGCAAGVCGIGACSTGFADCNNNASDGCETNIQTSNANCGACGTVCATGKTCVSGQCVQAGAPYVKLTGSPSPSAVFNTIDRTFYYPNNLVSGIWHGPSNQIVVGHYSSTGYWNHTANGGGYPASPNNLTPSVLNRSVYIPGANMIVYSTKAQYPSTAATTYVARMDPMTGALSGFQQATWGDNFTGNCNLFSSSATEFMCYDGTNIRKYTMADSSALLSAAGTVVLSGFASDVCSSYCFGGTFAWDGKYFYFAGSGSASSGLVYQVYDSAGAFVATYTASGSGGINSAYFDWSVGRYATHSGYGTRGGGSLYTWSGGSQTDDSQSYSPVSGAHSF